MSVVVAFVRRCAGASNRWKGHADANHGHFLGLVPPYTLIYAEEYWTEGVLPAHQNFAAVRRGVFFFQIPWILPTRLLLCSKTTTRVRTSP